MSITWMDKQAFERIASEAELRSNHYMNFSPDTIVTYRDIVQMYDLIGQLAAQCSKTKYETGPCF